MSDPFVADSSVGVAWATPTQGTPGTDQLLDDVALGRSVLVPSLWFLEVANTLLKLERTHRIPPGHRRKALAELAMLSPQVDDAPASSAFNVVSDVAEKYGLSVYDAAFLELALRRAVPLASRDQPLVEAAKKAGVSVIP